MPVGPLLVFGNDQSLNTGASVLTLYCNDPVVGGGNAGTLTITQPTASTSTTGWTVGTTGAGNFSRQTYNSKVATTNFTTTAQPSGSPIGSAQDAWRYGPLTGQFSRGTWYSSLSAIAVVSSGASGRARYRLWRSHNQDGTNATEVTQGMLIASTVANLLTTTAQSSAVSFAVNAFPIANEYLFLQVAWETE